MESILIATGFGLLGLGFAAVQAVRVMRKAPGNETMRGISEMVHEGAMTFLAREYRAIAVFAVLVAILLAVSLRAPGNAGLGVQTAIAFVVGALFSLAAGFVGLKIATRANARTTEAARHSFNEAMSVAFPAGSVMGMAVAGGGLFALSLLFYVFAKMLDLGTAASIVAGFSMGASSVALFARVGGGIFTKAADVGADLVGKVEAGIPEDDPRNPAVIADNVGDNVGDVAGMGADLYESFVGAIVSAIVIAFATPVDTFRSIQLALFVVCGGVLASIIGTFFVRTDAGVNPQRALRNGMIGSAALFIVFSFVVSFFIVGDLSGEISGLDAFLAILFGLIAGLTVGFVAEYYTSGRSVIRIAESSETGSATNIIAGFAVGLKSAVIPLVVIAFAVMAAYTAAGFFGLALAAIGMLAITGMTVSVDAYGPIADNAGGIAEMAQLPPEVRKITDKLDAAGNTTAAIAKGFAIGSAALTALALFMAYMQALKIASGGVAVTIDVMNPKVLAGMFIGGVVPFVFASDTMRAVGRSAFSVVKEVRRQFAEIPGLLEGRPGAKADSARCVDLATSAALREMIVPGILAVLIPLSVGIVLGPQTLAGLLAGSLISGVPLALVLANAGGAWDNAKKYIEEGNLGGKGSESHKAAVVGDTVGDPFKDTSGPALNILLKLMAVVSLVFVPLIVVLHDKVLSLF
jgi:K(+)-stimulated pyrophosphate-energized sodium pump